MTSSENHSSDSFKAIKLGDERTSLRESRGDGPSLERFSGDSPSLEKSKGEGPSLPSKQVLDLAYKIKTEEAREKQERIAEVDLRRAKMRHSRTNQFGLAGLILTFCLAAYYIYSDMRAKTRIDTVEINLIEKINLAYKGEQAALDEIARRIPVLTKSRLVKNIRQAESGRSNTIEPTNEPAIKGISSGEVASVSVVKVYSSQKLGAPIIATLANDANVLNINYGQEWSSITLLSGFPVWIHGDFVEEMAGNLLKVSGDRVNLRVLPDLLPESIVGRVNDGETLQILKRSNSWYQVNSPSDFEGWVRTKSLGDIL